MRTVFLFISLFIINISNNNIIYYYKFLSKSINAEYTSERVFLHYAYKEATMSF